jgi:malate dehydrogenase (oxaloacetate-decarboxylating)(NADP+)
MFLAAAMKLAHEVAEADLVQGRLFPPLTRIREVSVSIAMAVAEIAYNEGLRTHPKPEDLFQHIRNQMFHPTYRDYISPGDLEPSPHVRERRDF